MCVNFILYDFILEKLHIMCLTHYCRTLKVDEEQIILTVTAHNIFQFSFPLGELSLKSLY